MDLAIFAVMIVLLTAFLILLIKYTTNEKKENEKY